MSASRKNIEYLNKRGFKPVFNIIDNVATAAVKAYLEKEDINVQFVEPNNHRVNAAERAIQTFKCHIIAGLCICDEKFPAMLWDKIIKQGQLVASKRLGHNVKTDGDDKEDASSKVASEVRTFVTNFQERANNKDINDAKTEIENFEEKLKEATEG